MLKFGKISDIDTANGLARVNFEEDGIVSDWLHVSVKKSLKNKESFPYDINEPVWCILDEDWENGIIGGAIYNEETLPQTNGADLYVFEIEGGGIIKLDRSAKKLSITFDNIEFNGGSLKGLVKLDSIVSKLNTVENDLNTIKTAFTTWVPVSMDGGAALKTATTSWASSTLTPTVATDLENTKIKQ